MDSFRKANTRRSTPCRLLWERSCGKGFSLNMRPPGGMAAVTPINNSY